MKKVFEAEYPREATEGIAEWLNEKFTDENGRWNTYDTTVIVEVIEDN